MAGSETSRLLGAAMDGTSGAQADLLERLRPRIVLWGASRMSPELKRHVDPEDIAQEVLVAVHRRLESGERPDRFLAWLFTVAENRIRDLARHHGALKRAPVEPPARRTRTSPSAFAARLERLDRMRAALERLPETHRRILRQRSLEERTYAEIATETGDTEGACRVRHFRALAALRDVLTDLDEARTA